MQEKCYVLPDKMAEKLIPSSLEKALIKATREKEKRLREKKRERKRLVSAAIVKLKEIEQILNEPAVYNYLATYCKRVSNSSGEEAYPIGVRMDYGNGDMFILYEGQLKYGNPTAPAICPPEAITEDSIKTERDCLLEALVSITPEQIIKVLKEKM